MKWLSVTGTGALRSQVSRTIEEDLTDTKITAMQAYLFSATEWTAGQMFQILSL